VFPVLQNGPCIHFLWTNAQITPARHHRAAKETCGHGDLEMLDIAQVMLFILACAFLFGLTGFLFRDQIASKR
jgi:hypothetical protein